MLADLTLHLWQVGEPQPRLVKATPGQTLEGFRCQDQANKFITRL